MGRLLIVILLLPAIACAASGRHVVNMPDAASDSGQLVLVFSRKATNVVVAINGVLAVEQASAKRLEIRGVETGYVDVSIAADGVERASRVWIDSGQATAVPVGNAGSPERMNPLVATALSIAALLISRAATDYLF